MAAENIPAERLSVGNVLSSTFRVIGANLIPFCLLAAITEAPLAGLGWLKTTGGFRSLFSSAAITHPDITALIEAGVQHVIQTFLLFLLQAALIRTVLAATGSTPVFFSVNLKTMIQAAARLFPIAAIVSLPSAVDSFALESGEQWVYFLLAIPLTFIAICWSVVAPISVIEKTPALQSLERSWDLTRGSRWQIFGLFIITNVVGAIFSFAQLPIVRLETSPNKMIGLLLLMSNIFGAALLMLRATVFDTIYCQLRTLKEGHLLSGVAATFD